MRARLLQLLTAPKLPRQLASLGRHLPPHALVSLSIPLPDGYCDWLHFLPSNAPYWYHARPERDEYTLGLGHALHLTSDGPARFRALASAHQGLQAHWQHDGEPGRLFSGFAFAPDKQQILPNTLLAVPMLLLRSQRGRNTLTLSAPLAGIQEQAASWSMLLGISPPLPPCPLQTNSTGLAEQAWQARVKAALREIATGRIEKLVLSRTREIRAEQSLAQPARIAGTLSRLCQQQPESLIYAHGHGELVFLGATPERLVALRAGQISADALAGTAWSGSPDLGNAKNRHEQALVVKAIEVALGPLSTGQTRIEAANEHNLANLRHLRSRIASCARPETRLFDLVAALHPTPAIGGYPAAPALNWLQAHGELRHAWYAGGFGLLEANGDGDIAVALRSALINGQHALLQAGAGIVTGSTPANELAETEAKLQTMCAALGMDTRPQSLRA